MSVSILWIIARPLRELGRHYRKPSHQHVPFLVHFLDKNRFLLLLPCQVIALKQVIQPPQLTNLRHTEIGNTQVPTPTPLRSGPDLEHFPLDTEVLYNASEETSYA